MGVLKMSREGSVVTFSHTPLGVSFPVCGVLDFVGEDTG